MLEPSIFDQISKGIANAITDIREKVVEEPWFGCAVTNRESTAPQWPQAREAQPEPAEQEPERNARDRGIDR